MPTQEQLLQRIKKLEAQVDFFIKADRYQFKKDVEITDGKNVRISGVTGTKIGLNSTDKLAFWGHTPSAQPSSSGETTGTATGVGTALKHDDLHYGGSITGVNVTGYTINDIVKHAKNVGWLKR